MAPEIIKRENYNSKCDLWIIGIIIYRLLFFHPPYSGLTDDAILKHINTLGKMNLESSGNILLDDLIYKLLEKDPNKRLDWAGYFAHPIFKEKNTNRLEISGILLLFLVAFISENILDINRINNIKIKEIINFIKEENENKLKDNINNFSNLKLKNIMGYSQYISSIINENEINNLYNLIDKYHKKKVLEFYSNLIKFQNLNLLFEKEFLEAQKNSYFDYALINITLNLNQDINLFLKEQKNCHNCIQKCLFHGTRNEIVMKILKEGFIYAKRHFFGIGVYFTDMLDYVYFYCGGKSLKDKRENWGKISPVNNTFSLVGTLIYYDNKKKKEIYDDSYYEKEDKESLTYEEIKKKYPEKMIEKNGINISKIDLLKGRILNQEQIKKNEELDNIIGTDYAITEMN